MNLEPIKKEPCIFCAGFGYVKGDECWGCEGTGKKSDSDHNLGWSDNDIDPSEDFESQEPTA